MTSGNMLRFLTNKLKSSSLNEANAQVIDENFINHIYNFLLTLISFPLRLDPVVKTFFINVSYHIRVASLTLMALF